MDLPSEILLSILESLEKRELKASRLVSKAWCACASTLLFAEIYVSCAKEDLEAFEAVTRSPLLSSCVRCLKYDATEFLEIPTKSQYIAELWVQRPYIYHDNSPWNTPDLEVNEWVNTVVLDHCSMQDTIAKFKRSGLIDRGYRKYREHARYQQDALQSSQFLQRLVRGLQNLNSLHSVTLQGTWPDIRESNRRYTGSYLARHWDPFYCRPQHWRLGRDLTYWEETLESWKKYPVGSQSFQVITSALSQARTHLTSFSIGSEDDRLSPGLPPTLFDISGYATSQKVELSGPDLDVFTKIERLVFRLASVDEEALEGQTTPELFGNLGGLQLLLKSMEHVKYLELRLSCDHSEPQTFYSKHQVFPKDIIWHNLETLKLMQFSVTATGLLNFLLYQTPNLRHLKIGAINLLAGTWEGFLEALAVSNHLTSFEFESDTPLYHRGGRSWWIDAYPGTLYRFIPQFHKDLELYVAHGGRHPCLRRHQPNTEARGFLKEFDPILRERLIELGTLRPERAI